MTETDMPWVSQAPGTWVTKVNDLPGCPAILHSWLSEPGLLTARLEKLASGPIAVQVLGQTPCIFADDSAPSLCQVSRTMIARRVLLKAEMVNWVFAETLIPMAAWQSTTWLRHLGDQPLGAAIQKAGAKQTSRFEYSALMSSLSLRSVVPALSTEDRLMARRRWHQLNGFELLVQEVFLPNLVNAITARS